jgi:hypothetical protein
MGHYMTDERYIRTDEAEDVAGSIRHALRCAAFVSEDPQAWKWGILALHSALQGACVCHLTTTAAPLGAVTKSNAKEWINYFDERRVSQNVKCPDTKLMTLPDLLKAVRKYGSAGGSTASNLVEISDIELVWLKRIHFEIRNQFVHFAPQGWSIEVSGVPQIGRIIARIIKDIHDCGWAFRHLDQTKKDTMVIDLEHLTEAIWSA